MIGALEVVVEHVEAERLGHQAEDRLGRGDRRAGIALADASRSSDSVHQATRRRSLKRLRYPAAPSGSAAGQRLGREPPQGRHGARVVPEVRIAPLRRADQAATSMTTRSSVGRGFEQVLHPVVVVGAVHDHEPGVGDARATEGGGSKSCGSALALIADVLDRDTIAADGRGDLAVEVLGGDDGDGQFGGEGAAKGNGDRAATKARTRKDIGQRSCWGDAQRYNITLRHRKTASVSGSRFAAAAAGVTPSGWHRVISFGPWRQGELRHEAWKAGKNT